MNRASFYVPFMTLVIIACSPCSWAAAPQPDAPRFEAYCPPHGDCCFALTLPAAVLEPDHRPIEVVIQFDTSASQLGAFREKGLEVLRGLLSTLGDDDRVKLMAVDVRAAALNESFIPPRGDEISGAIEKLRQRVPLGATDLEAALNAGMASFKKESPARRALVYIGDGQSNANFMGVDVQALIDRLIDRHISVHSFAVGPTSNVEMLAALANETGGVVIADGPQLLGPEAGSKLSHAMHEPAVWPDTCKLPDSLTKIYPARTPPLRPDRDTVLVGIGTANRPFAVEIHGISAAGPVDLKWEVTPHQSDDNNAYLAKLIHYAQHDNGYTLPILGSQGLEALHRLSIQSADTIAQLAKQAAAAGNAPAAKRLADEAARQDPDNPQSLVLKRVGAVRKVSATRQVAAGGPAAEGPENTEAPPGELLNSVEQMQRVIQQQVMTEATVGLNHARDQMAKDPAAVINDLKRLLDRVLRVAELTGDQRADLRNRIASTLQRASQALAEKESAAAQRLQNLAAAEDRQRVLNRLDRRETQLAGLVDRFDALVDLGNQNDDQVINDNLRAARRDAADEIHRAAVNAYGREPSMATTAPQYAGFALAQAEGMAVREAAERSYMDTLHLVDVSHIPFPDSPPIIYPDAQFWRKITADRKKWSGVDLAGSNPSEQKILDALNEKINFDVSDQPLSEAMTYLSDKKHIPIQFDTAALKDASIDPATVPIGTTIKDLSVRSALKLILSQYNLTYVIKDEVLQITTTDKANAALVTKVYPVADLVIPVTSPQLDTAMLGGGMAGMMGGGMGMMGGGMMGGGMGMMGGGMGMMGGGMGGMMGGFGGGGF